MTVAPHTGQIVESGGPAPAEPIEPIEPARHFTWRSEDDTAAFAGRLAAQPQLANAFVTLHGDLGAGKTTLVRHLLRALGVQGRIKSPTYAVVEPHDAPGLAPHPMVWHFDFYRFDDPREWEDAGFRDIFANPGLKLAEWPEKAAALTPPADLAIHIEAIDDTTRTITVHAHTADGRQMLQGL
ncbi:tRNA (adenosine(37)-N6)-threonylcarbamoyltransferase complex ATPase subunit type 1 TsaE [Acidovorax sp. LjRoot129]|uniref:tRNA (adenosine(37)-N6)-threonylcarbamoyltransferase complex ATPase subunit type 1 TsaE n=1 Tax=Acidovorax sp. LjRoot129 TaxID=3342260 RepID=UPI003ECD0DD2